MWRRKIGLTWGSWIHFNITTFWSQKYMYQNPALKKQQNLSNICSSSEIWIIKHLCKQIQLKQNHEAYLKFFIHKTDNRHYLKMPVHASIFFLLCLPTGSICESIASQTFSSLRKWNKKTETFTHGQWDYFLSTFSQKVKLSKPIFILPDVKCWYEQKLISRIFDIMSLKVLDHFHEVW